ncbi:MAG TPA: ABC transporter permease [Candidatus Hydrogenedentes bacterium]|nr:ABC transporter permease [Candidatus Hydrogenedentota bacterium]
MTRFLAKHSPLVILAALCIVLAVESPDFRKPGNLKQVAARTSPVAIIAVGQTLVILTAGIDLSVGSVAALGGIAAALTMRGLGEEVAGAMVYPRCAVPVGVLVGLAIGALCGFLNGVLSSRGRIPPFIATLGMMMAARGAALLLSGGMPISRLPTSFGYLGGGQGWHIPVSITLAIVVVVAVTLGFTRYGRAVYATGGNAVGARLSGIPVDRVRVVAFSMCGLLSGLAGVMLASYTTIAAPTAAEGMELNAIAACVIGGASLMGGEGGAVGSLAGALIMNFLNNFCTLKNWDDHWQKVFVGALVVALVFYDNLRKRRAGLTRE